MTVKVCLWMQGGRHLALWYHRDVTTDMSHLEIPVTERYVFYVVKPQILSFDHVDPLADQTSEDEYVFVTRALENISVS